jgi:hypothetical protein
VALALLALVGVPSLLTRATQPRRSSPRTTTTQRIVATPPPSAAEPTVIAAVLTPALPEPAAEVAIVEPQKLKPEPSKIVARAETPVAPKRALRRPVEAPHARVVVSAEPALQPTAADSNAAVTLASATTTEPSQTTESITATASPPAEPTPPDTTPHEVTPTAPTPEPVAALPAPIALLNAGAAQPNAAKAIAPVTALVLKPEAQPIARAIDPARAHVTIGTAITHHAAVSRASVRGALNESGLNRCYQDAMRAGDAPKTSVDAELDLSTGMGGHVTSATLQGALSKSLRACIEQVARGGRLREADTGETQASIPLSFRPE